MTTVKRECEQRQRQQKAPATIAGLPTRRGLVLWRKYYVSHLLTGVPQSLLKSISKINLENYDGVVEQSVQMFIDKE